MNPARDMLNQMREDRQRREHGPGRDHESRDYRRRWNNGGGVVYFVPQPYNPAPAAVPVVTAPPPAPVIVYVPVPTPAPAPEPETPPAVTPPSPQPVAPAAPTTMYMIPGCYLGNVKPKASDLRAGCDISKLTTFTP